MIPGSRKSHGKGQAVSTAEICEPVLRRKVVLGISGQLAAKIVIYLPEIQLSPVNGWHQCAKCRHQVSVTAESGLHKADMPLTQ